MFFLGVHPGNFAIEIGNPDLAPEHALGFDVSLRWRSARASGEVTYFRNDISDYIFRNPLTVEQFEERQPEFAARFPNRELEFPEEELEEFQVIEFVSADSVLQGFEAHADFEVGAGIAIELGADMVRGTLEDSSDPLPRIPPFRVRTGARYQRNAFQAGGEVIAAAEQDRVFGAETPTEGYALLKLFASYTFGTDRVANTVTLRADNATNELYRNHLSLLKDLVPETGRNFKLLYSVRF
jgi:iron complex outermembrane receptor protein